MIEAFSAMIGKSRLQPGHDAPNAGKPDVPTKRTAKSSITCNDSKPSPYMLMPAMTAART